MEKLFKKKKYTKVLFLAN
jgi:hypothetical protein